MSGASAFVTARGDTAGQEKLAASEDAPLGFRVHAVFGSMCIHGNQETG